MIDEAAQDAVFQALASATRRRLLDVIRELPGATVNDVAKHFPMSRIGVMKHLGVLEAAGLVVSRKSGRTRQLFFNAIPIQLIYDRWTSDYASFWAGRAMDLKYRLEGLVPTPPSPSSS